MFYRDAQTLVITTLRGTCIHGNIVIHIRLVHAQGNFREVSKSNNERARILIFFEYVVYIILINLWLFFCRNIIHDI